MPRSAEQNAELRENKRRQILDAALNVYIRFGYHGTDMDEVAKDAKLAKGLVYYYFKTKKELFAELYTWMFNEGFALSEKLLNGTRTLNPVEQLIAYTYGMFAANGDNPRMMQFNIRVPFDAFAIFGPEEWKDGAAKSDMHRKALAGIIARGIDAKLIPVTDPSRAANSFWSVFVANSFEYSKLIAGKQEARENSPAVFKEVVRFCFQGLGIAYEVWNGCIEREVWNERLPQ